MQCTCLPFGMCSFLNFQTALFRSISSLSPPQTGSLQTVPEFPFYCGGVCHLCGFIAFSAIQQQTVTFASSLDPVVFQFPAHGAMSRECIIDRFIPTPPQERCVLSPSTHLIPDTHMHTQCFPTAQCASRAAGNGAGEGGEASLEGQREHPIAF